MDAEQKRLLDAFRKAIASGTATLSYLNFLRSELRRLGVGEDRITRTYHAGLKIWQCRDSVKCTAPEADA